MKPGSWPKCQQMVPTQFLIEFPIDPCNFMNEALLG